MSTLSYQPAHLPLSIFKFIINAWRSHQKPPCPNPVHPSLSLPLPPRCSGINHNRLALILYTHLYLYRCPPPPRCYGINHNRLALILYTHLYRCPPSPPRCSGSHHKPPCSNPVHPSLSLTSLPLSPPPPLRPLKDLLVC